MTSADAKERPAGIVSSQAVTPAPARAQEPAPEGGGDRNELLRQLATVLANVSVLTALLVYFGWVRSEVQSNRLGVDESIFGMSTREYLLRSVRSVMVLLIVIAVAGLLWLLADRWLLGRLQDNGASDPVLRWSLRLLPAGLVALPLTAWLVRPLWPAPAFIAFPLCGVAGLLLVLYTFHLRQRLPGATPLPAGRETLLRGFTAIIVGVGLFWATANYAIVEGTELAGGFRATIPRLPRVVVYSPEHLHIDAPGAREEPLSPEHSAYRYRYVGLRFLEHTGGNYFLVSDEWSPRYGVVIMLADDDPVRLEFVRDRR
jgi:hypothetical protein